MSGYYGWDGQPITMEEWAKLFEAGNKVLLDVVGGVEVSTVWLGIDHQFLSDGPPLIFETMIFGGEHDDKRWRYTTRSQAEVGHARAVELVRG